MNGAAVAISRPQHTVDCDIFAASTEPALSYN
jgi:hypothetical protein